MPLVENKGELWIVPTWLPEPDGEYAKPERAIQLRQFPFETFGPLAQFQFGIRELLPKELFFGELTSTLKNNYIVVSGPNWRFRVELPSKKPH
jgi:hypothetical protein